MRKGFLAWIFFLWLNTNKKSMWSPIFLNIRVCYLYRTIFCFSLLKIYNKYIYTYTILLSLSLSLSLCMYITYIYTNDCTWWAAYLMRDYNLNEKFFQSRSLLSFLSALWPTSTLLDIILPFFARAGKLIIFFMWRWTSWSFSSILDDVYLILLD